MNTLFFQSLLRSVAGPLLGLSLFAASAAALRAEVVPGVILVKYRPGAAARALAPGAAARAQERVAGLGLTRLHFAPGADLGAALKTLRADPAVQFAEPDYVRHPLLLPNDPSFASQYGPQKIDAPDAWSLTTGSSGVTIAVLDSGVDGTHPDLAGHVLPGIDDAQYPSGVTPTGAWHDALGHGTHCAGIAAASINNGIGVAGTAGGDTILPIKVFPDVGSADDVTLARAIHDAADNGARVISMSLGGPGASSVIQDAVNYAWGKGAVIVAAAGNDSNNEVFYPADAANVVAVAGTDENDNPAWYTNYGPSVAIAAPGSDILSTVPGGYAWMSGTSMATPFVAGVAGLAFALTPAATNAQVVAALEAGADKVGPYAYDATGRNDHYGHGRLNAYHTLTALTGPIPLWRFHNSYNNEEFYTASATEAAAVAGYMRAEGTAAQVYRHASDAPGLVPLYRFYNPYADAHFWTANQTERNTVSQYMHLEGVVAYVFPGAASDPTRKPMYRAYNPATDRHLFTQSTAEFNGLPAPWIREGVAFYTR